MELYFHDAGEVVSAAGFYSSDPVQCSDREAILRYSFRATRFTLDINTKPCGEIETFQSKS